MMMRRTPQQEAAEKVILDEAREIEAARKAEEAQRRAAAPAGTSSPPESALQPFWPLRQPDNYLHQDALVQHLPRAMLSPSAMCSATAGTLYSIILRLWSDSRLLKL